jgi:hypothetical protein
MEHRLTIQLIRYEIAQIPVDNDLLEQINDDLLYLVYKFAIEQDVAYIVGSALTRLGVLSGDLRTAFFNEQLGSVYRDEQFRHDTENVSVLFSAQEIKHIMLKGAVIKGMYPKSEMRTSCDIDILINEDDLEKALNILYDNGYTYVSKTKHDVMLMTPAQSYIELHYTLNEYEFEADNILKNAWDYTQKKTEYEYEFIPHFFVFYQISHIARHMYTGGCGIRAFLDLKIIFDRMEFDKEALKCLLEKASLAKFFDTTMRLVNLWFGNSEDISDELKEYEMYILKSGIYGNLTNKLSVINEKRGNRNHVKSVLFPPYRVMAEKYSVLNKMPYLLPFMYLIRGVQAVFKGKKSTGFSVIKASRAVTEDKQNEVTTLLKNLELM